MDIIKTLKDASKAEHWKDAFVWLMWSCIGGLMPIWATLLGLMLFSQNVDMSVLTDDAEFALYAATFISGSLYIIGRDLPRRNFPSFSVVSLLLVCLLLFSTYIYAQVSITHLLGGIEESGFAKHVAKINISFIEWVSWILLPAVIFISFIIAVAENVRARVDVTRARERDMDTLNDQFDRL